MKAIIVISIALFLGLTSCRKTHLMRNLKDWEGTWSIEKVAKDTGGGGFLNNGWKRSQTLIENYGTLTVDENSTSQLYLRNTDYSEIDAPVTMSCYLQYAGKSHVSLIGMTIAESENPDLPVGKIACNDGAITFWIKHSVGKERVFQVEYLNFYCDFSPAVGDGAYYWYLRKTN